MNYRVADFDEMEDDYGNIPISSGFSRHKTANEGEIMELLWQNGQVVVQRPSKKNSTTPFVGGSGSGDAVIPGEQPVVKEIRGSGAEEQHHFFMQEDEMASWLHYPLDDSSLTYGDLFYSAPHPIAPTTTVAEIRPPPITPPAQKPPKSSPRIQNFGHFSRIPSQPRIESMSKPPATIAGELTVVESNETPMVGKESRVSHTAAPPPTNRELAAVTRELTATSSPGGSGTSFSGSADTRSATPKQDQPPPPLAVGRKRKDREADDNECRSEDIEFEGTECKRQCRTTSASTKRSRAAEVHNQSERRRRDRINEKMRALQELIPRCNKSDKASMLDEAIEYLKSLQMQVQMVSMGCGMVPIMYPGMQQYMPAMGMGMGVGVGMDMGMNRPMVPYPSMLQVPGSAMPNTAAASQLGPRFPLPGFHLPHDHSRIQPSNHHDPMRNSLLVHNPNHPQMQNFVDPYHQFLGPHQPQLPLPQTQAMGQNNVKPSTSKEVGNTENKQTGRK